MPGIAVVAIVAVVAVAAVVSGIAFIAGVLFNVIVTALLAQGCQGPGPAPEIREQPGQRLALPRAWLAAHRSVALCGEVVEQR